MYRACMFGGIVSIASILLSHPDSLTAYEAPPLEAPALEFVDDSLAHRVLLSQVTLPEIPDVDYGKVARLAVTATAQALAPLISAEPTPVVEPQPSPPEEEDSLAQEPPTLKIQAPDVVEMGHLIVVKFEYGGGPVRECEKVFDPPISDSNFAPSTDPNMMFFTAPEGIYTLRVLCIGKTKGYCRDEVKIHVRNPRPEPKVEIAKTTAPPTPRILLKKWLSESVTSSNLRDEAREIAKAGHDTAAALRLDPSQGDPIELWQVNVATRLGAAAKGWNINPKGNSFFQYMAELHEQNKSLPEANSPNFIDSMSSLLEGK